MEDRATEVDLFGLALVVYLFKFSNKVNNQAMCVKEFGFDNPALVEDANGTYELAEIGVERVGKDAIEEAWAQDKNVHEEFPSFVAAGNLLSGVATRSVK